MEKSTAELVGEYNRLSKTLARSQIGRGQVNTRQVKAIVKKREPIRLELIGRGYTGLRYSDERE